MQTINLGFQAPDYSSMANATPESPQKPDTKECFPSMNIPGNLALAKSLQAGQEFTATVKFRVAEIRIKDRGEEEDGPVDTYGGTGVELEAQSMVIDGVKVEDGNGEEDGASAIKDFFNKKK